MTSIAWQQLGPPDIGCTGPCIGSRRKHRAWREARRFSSLTFACLAWFAALAGGLAQVKYQPGQSYFGRSNYIEYLAGDMPVILSAPHGGALKPAEIPDRKSGEFISDACTEELARTVYQVFHDRFGHYPHVVICRLERRKLDVNRVREEAAGGDPSAEQAWQEYHGFIETARSNALASTGKGFYIDLHGQSNPIKRVELGYCLSESQLTNADSVLNQPGYADRSTVRGLAQRSHLPFAELLRGTNSFGALLAAKGYPAVPSPAMPSPGQGNYYFDGGYSVRRHCTANGNVIDGLQMELNLAGVRDAAANRTKFCLALAEVLDSFFRCHYHLDLKSGRAL